MSEQTAQTNPAVVKSPLDEALLDEGEKLFQKLSRGRFSEEINWYETALMYQNKQWLRLTGSGKTARWEAIKQDLNKPKPMPVSNYLADTTNTLANKLGARIPEMIALPDDDSDNNREGADYAERACEEIDKESKMDIQNPILAKHVCLFGTGVTKDSIEGGNQLNIPEIGTDQQQSSICMDCGVDVPQDSPVCSQCGSPNIEPLSSIIPVVKQVLGIPQNKIRTDVKLIFSIYVPRNCKDPNLAKLVVERTRMTKEEAEELYPNMDFEGETSTAEKAEFYEEALQALGGFGSQAGNTSAEMITFTEIWSDYSVLPKKIKDALQGEQGFDVQTAQSDGIMWVYGGGKLVEKKANNQKGKKPYTFYQWEKDPANPYCKAPADDLKPLQKQLNRLDSLTERYLTTGGGKWLVPKTQQGSFQATGDPIDVHYWDPIGDGKIAPQFIQAATLGSWIAAKRQSIIADIERIGRTQGVTAGTAPTGVKSFRGVAYLGQKADEQLDTPRYLFEQAHSIRKEKVLYLAQRYWDEPRKVRVAGFNGRSGAAMLDGSMLNGDYEIQWVEGSSRKKTLDEEMESFQVLLEAGMVNVMDPQTRDFVFDRLNLEGVNMADHLQFEKAIRDLDLLKKGQTPRENSMMKWDIPLLIMSQFMQTEEFEGLDPQIQMFIEQYCQYISDKLTAIKMNSAPAGSPQADPNQMALQALQGMGEGKSKGNNPLNGVPGKSDSTGNIEKAAESEGKNVEHQVSPA
jgi:hypothetical protein